MNNFRIKHIEAGEILDSRGMPTVATKVVLESGAEGEAAVPSGASTGKLEAHELRDKNPERYGGRGVLKACSNVNVKIKQALFGMDALYQAEVDAAMNALDGTPDKSNLGANAILSVSLAVARAAAAELSAPLYDYLSEQFFSSSIGAGEYTLPTPIMNMINGGQHASTNLAIQEFQIIPVMDGVFSRQLEAGSEIFHELGKILAQNKMDTDVGNEGGYAPDMNSIEQVFALMIEAMANLNVRPGTDALIGLDAAANSFYDEGRNKYVINPPPRELSALQLAKQYQAWMRKYPIVAIEDPFAEDAWDDWSRFMKNEGAEKMVIGDDLFVTNAERLQKGIDKAAANAILIKPNQIGTLSETVKTIKLAQKYGFEIIVSHRSGETGDDFIADLAVAARARYIKAGPPSRGERVAKYNRLLAIEKELTRNI